MSEPFMSQTVKAVENLDFLVVHDIFMCDTAKVADVVLPATANEWFREHHGQGAGLCQHQCRELSFGDEFPVCEYGNKPVLDAECAGP